MTNDERVELEMRIECLEQRLDMMEVELYLIEQITEPVEHTDTLDDVWEKGLAE